MKYYIKSEGQELEDAVEFTHFHDEILEVAEEAAEEYHDNGGWEASWPITFTIVCDDGEEIDVDVERESVPHFTASITKPATHIPPKEKV